MSKGIVLALLFVAAAIAVAVGSTQPPTEQPQRPVQPLAQTSSSQSIASGCPDGQVVGPEGVCLKPYDGEYTPIPPPPPGFVIDEQPVLIDEPMPARAIALAPESGPDLATEYLRQRHAAEDAYQAQRRAHESAYQQEVAYTPSTVQVQPTALDDATSVAAAPQTQPLIRYTNTMPNVTAVQVAPDVIWDYSTGQYHFADQQADGSLQQRVGE